MKILNTTSTTPSPRESLLGRKIQIEITGREYAIIRALLGMATSEMDLYSAFQNLVPTAELNAAKDIVRCHIVPACDSIKLIIND